MSLLITILGALTSPVNLITFGAFAVIVIAIFLTGVLMIRLSQDPIRDRLESLAKDDNFAPSAGIWEGLAHQLPQTRIDNGVLDRELRRAGFYKPTARLEFLGLRNGLTILALVCAGVIAVILGPSAPRIEILAGSGVRFPSAMIAVFVGLVVAALCWAIPRLVLQWLGNRRVNRITSSLPFAMDMLTMTMAGGLTIREAMHYVSRELYFANPAMAVELLIIRQHAELTSVDNAFEQFAKRIDTPDVIAMSSLIQQGQRLGTDVVTSINEFADGLRLKRRQTADARSSRAAVHMLFPLALMLLGALIILWGPALLQMIDFVKNELAEGL